MCERPPAGALAGGPHFRASGSCILSRMRIEIKYDDREVRKALERLRKAGADMRPAMREIAGHLADGVYACLRRRSSRTLR